MITEIDLSQYYIKKQEIQDAFQIEGDAATIIKDKIEAKPNLGTSHNDAARGDHTHDGVYLKSYTPPTASTSGAGIVQLNTSTDDSSVTQAATPSAVQAVYQLAQEKSVTVNKLSTATNGYLATYEIKQGGVLLGKIEIPKDFLIKSGSVKTSQAADNPELGYKKGDKYIDFVINVKEGSGVNSHIYVNLRDLIDVYVADEKSLQLITNESNVKEFSIKENGVNGTHIANGVIENRHISVNTKIPFSKLNITKQDIVGLEIPGEDTNTLYYADGNTIELGNNNHFKVKDNLFADKNHEHGYISKDGTINSETQDVNKIVITNSNNQIKVINKMPYSKLSDTPFIPRTTKDLDNTAEFTTANGHNHDSQYVQSKKNSYVNGVLSDNLITRTMTLISMERMTGSQPLYSIRVKINDFDPSKETPIVKEGIMVNKNVDYTDNIWNFTMVTDSYATITIPEYENKSMAKITIIP